MIYIQVKRKNEKLMAEQIEWVLTLIYFEKNSQRCKNKKYEKYIPYFAPGKRLRILIYSFYPNFLNRYYWRNKRYIRKTGKPLF